MEPNILMELIQTLNSEEREKVTQFADLHLFTRTKMKLYVVALLNLCLDHRCNDSGPKTGKEEMFAAVFPGHTFVEGKLEKVMVEAHKVVQTFLSVEYYLRSENEFHQVFDYAEVIRTRGLDLRYKHLLLRLRRMQKDAPLQGPLFFHDQYLLEYAYHNEESLYNQKKGDLNIPDTLDALEMHLHLNRIALLNVYLLQQKAANISVPEAMKERLQEANVPERFLEQSPAIKINYVIFSLLKKSSCDASDAQMLFNLLLLHEKSLDSQALSAFYTYLRNICALILSRNYEQKDINNTLYELYKDNLARGYLHYEGKLHPSRYLAISECAARAEKQEWAFEFIEKHKHEIIGENEKQDIYRLNLALYLFTIGQFSKCVDNIPSTSPFVDYLIAGKRLELKALYELQSDLFSYKLDAFKMFISRTSPKLLSDDKRKMNVDFLNLLFQLVGSTPGDQNRAKTFRERVDEKKQAAEWHWLIAKANQLIEKI